MERRLGRGLGSLLTKPDPRERPLELPLDRIRPNPHQPRRTFDETGLAELRASIETHGVLQPVVVRVVGSDAQGELYELVSGERRCRASRLAGRHEIPAVVRAVRDEEMLELALVENVQRRDLDPIERAEGFRQLLERLELTQEEVAQRVGLRRSTVTNHLRLLELPQPAREALAQGLVTMGHARALLGLTDPGARVDLLEAIVRDGLSVREVERRVRVRQAPAARKEDLATATIPAPPRGGSRATEHREPWVGEIEARLRESLGTKVRIQDGPGYRGQIVLEYYDLAGLQALIDRLAPKKGL